MVYQDGVCVKHVSVQFILMVYVFRTCHYSNYHDGVCVQDVSVRFTVMDQDRHTGPTELGRATVSLKEAKQTVQVQKQYFDMFGNIENMFFSF